MQDRSTMTMVEYRSSIFWKVVIGFVWYKGLLFRTLLPLGTRASLVVLAGVLALADNSTSPTIGVSELWYAMLTRTLKD